jgi:hypothetical protein
LPGAVVVSVVSVVRSGRLTAPGAVLEEPRLGCVVVVGAGAVVVGVLED